MLRVEGLCLGIHGTWRAGGADAGEAAGSVSEDRSLFSGATDKEGGGSWTGIGRRGRLGICVLGKKQEEKELLFLFPSRGGRRRRVKRPRKTAIWLWLCSSAKLQSS